MSQKTILVLGKTGMAGHMIFNYFNSLKKYNVFGTSKEELDAEWDIIKIEKILEKYKPDYIINCIGIINKYSDKDPPTTKRINSIFPHMLAYLCIKNNWKLIHISTDCYLDGDVYGKSKFLGEINDKQNLTIRTSIIGPELKDGYGLFHWFMSQQGEANGFVKAYWDGVTTLQLAKFMHFCINSPQLFGIIDYRTRKSISKYKLLILISKIFNKKIVIRSSNQEMKDKRNKNPDFWCEKDYQTQLAELKSFMQGNQEYESYFNINHE